MEGFIYHNNKGCLVILAILMCLFVDALLKLGVDPMKPFKASYPLIGR